VWIDSRSLYGPGSRTRAWGRLELMRLFSFLYRWARRFYEDGCLLHASALAYTTMLSIVPVLALMFAALKGLGVESHLEDLLLQRLSLSQEVATQITEFVSRANVGTLGTMGAIALFGSVLSVLGSVESSFNYIWRVRAGRPLLRKITDYVSVIILAPFLMVAATGVTSFVLQQELMHEALARPVLGEAWRSLLPLVPYLCNVIAIGFLYVVMPNRRPQPRALLFSALFAGIAWQLVQIGYVRLQVGVASYNAIYGALAQLPVTLVWMYVSWAIVLAGAELAACLELGGAEGAGRRVSRRPLALAFLVEAARRLRSGEGPTDPAEVSRQLGVDRVDVCEAVEAMEDVGLVLPVEGANGRYLLARDPASISLAEVFTVFAADGLPLFLDGAVAGELAREATVNESELRAHSLADLVKPDIES